MSDKTIFDIQYEESISPLARAAKVGDLDTVKNCLKRGCLPQTPDNRGWCPVHVAASANQYEALKLILNFKKNSKKYLTNICTWQDETPLLLAAKAEGISLSVIQLLLESGSDPNITDCKGRSALHYICKRSDNVEAVKLLVICGAKVNEPDQKNGFTPIAYAILRRYEKIFDYLVEFIDLTDISRKPTPLFNACYSGFTRAVQKILSKDKTTINIGADVDVYPPISVATKQGHLDIVKILVEAGADIESKVYVSGQITETLTVPEFLPIHESVCSKVDIFKYFLNVMNPSTLFEHERTTVVGSLPVYTVWFSDEAHIEALLQHPFPKEYECLKVPDFEKVIDMIYEYNFLSHGSEIKLASNFYLFYKYYSHIDPNDFFYALKRKLDHLMHFTVRMYYYLLRIGVLDQIRRDMIPDVNILLPRVNLEADTVAKIQSALHTPLLTLKKLCRFPARQCIRSNVSDDWAAYCFIRDSHLPMEIKKFLWYEDLKEENIFY